MISKILSLALCAALVAVGVLWVSLSHQKAESARLSAKLSLATSALHSCTARQSDRDDHKDRSDEIDALPDADLRDRLRDWMLDG